MGINMLTATNGFFTERSSLPLYCENSLVSILKHVGASVKAQPANKQRNISMRPAGPPHAFDKARRSRYNGVEPIPMPMHKEAIPIRTAHAPMLRAAAILLLALLCAGCSTPGNESVPQSPSSVSPATASSVQDYDRAELEAAVSRAVLAEYGKAGEGVYNAEGHVLLGTHKKKGIEFVYAVVSFGAYKYENGAFTRENGLDALPVVLLFSRDAQGRHKLQEYKAPPSGSRYLAGVQELFPEGEIRKQAEDPAQFRQALDQQMQAYLDTYTEKLN